MKKRTRKIQTIPVIKAQVKETVVEPVKVEPVKVEPIKAEPIKTEPVKKIEPAIVEPIKVELIKAEVVKVEPITIEPAARIKPKWKVEHGGFTGLNRVYHPTGDVFEAEEWEIPMAFRDIVKCINPDALVPKEKPIEPKYFLQEVVPTAEEADEDDYVQLYNIINARDKVISEKPLPKGEATVLLKKLNG